MKTHNIPSRLIRNVCLVLLLSILAFPGFGRNGLAAASALPRQIQDGEDAQVLSCTCTSSNLQVVLMIDDSGSMAANDPNSLRSRDAQDLIELLAGLRSTEWGIRDVEVAVLHFADTLASDSPEELISVPSIPTEATPAERNELLEPLLGATYAWKDRATNFIHPFERAKKLFSEAQPDCTRRSIVLFTDGTPEENGRIKLGEDRQREFTDVRTTIQQIPNLDGVYVVGYQKNIRYLNEEVKKQWANTVTWYGFQRNLSTSQDEVPRFELIPVGEFQQKIAEETAVKEPDFKSIYHVNVEIDGEQAPLQANIPGDVSFQVILSGTTPIPALKAENVSAIFRGQTIPLLQDGQGYVFTLTPANVSEVRFDISADFVNETGEKLLSCSGSVVRPVLPPVDPSSGLELFIESSGKSLRQDEAILLPVRLEVTGEMTDLQWGEPVALSVPDGSSVRVQREPSGANDREYNLILAPLGRPGEVEVRVNASAVINGHNISSAATTRLMIQTGAACEYGVIWNYWFWPLAIVLAALMLLLLVLRFRKESDENEKQDGLLNIFHRREWHILFWPLLALLLLLILLVRVWPATWICSLPPWLFLVSLLGWVAILLLLRFIPGHGDFPRPRPWWLVLLLLVLIFAGFLTLRAPLLTLLWLLLFLAATWITLWYISPYRPTPPMPPVLISLASAPACVPFNESVTLPLLLDVQGLGAALKSIIWSPSAQVMAGGEAEARVVAVDEGSGMYELIVDPVGYDRNARELRVQVRAQVILANGRSIDIHGQTTRIELCQPDHLAELEGIGETVQDLLYRKGILTFKQLAGTDKGDLIRLLDLSDLKMMDPKTWPQQAKLAEIARQFGGVDQENYEAYKAWLRNGIEPDEYDLEEKDRRADVLVWNKIAEFTPLALHLALNPAHLPARPIRLPLQVHPNGDHNLLSMIEWKASAKTVPGDADVGTTLTAVDPQTGRYELLVDPVTGADQIQIHVQAAMNGRSIEFYDRAVTVQIPSGTPDMILPILRDDLTKLEGIETGVQNLLNTNHIYTFKELAEADPRTIEDWLKEKPWGKMMDPKTWPQQARLADIAERYGKDEDRKNYEAYKAWLRNGIEPDEYDKEEPGRRRDVLVWNKIADVTPLVLNLALSPTRMPGEPIVLPVQVSSAGDKAWLSAVEWQVGASTVPGGEVLGTKLQDVHPDLGQYELVIDPVTGASEIQVDIRAAVNGRSIEFYDRQVTVQVPPSVEVVLPPVPPDDLTELEGIGKAVMKVLNDNGIFTFKQLAGTGVRDLKAWLDECGYQRMDPKTWPQQAKLASIAGEFGVESDRQSYEAYKDWLRNGIEPDEYILDEKDRRQAALAWYGTAELTEKAYPEIFKAQ